VVGPLAPLAKNLALHGERSLRDLFSSDGRGLAHRKVEKAVARANLGGPHPENPAGSSACKNPIDTLGTSKPFRVPSRPAILGEADEFVAGFDQIRGQRPTFPKPR